MATMPQEADIPQPKPSIHMSVTIEFEHMTWGELRGFIAMADHDGVPDDEMVALAFVPDVDDFEPIGLTFSTYVGADGDI